MCYALVSVSSTFLQSTSSPSFHHNSGHKAAAELPHTMEHAAAVPGAGKGLQQAAAAGDAAGQLDCEAAQALDGNDVKLGSALGHGAYGEAMLLRTGWRGCRCLTFPICNALLPALLLHSARLVQGRGQQKGRVRGHTVQACCVRDPCRRLQL